MCCSHSFFLVIFGALSWRFSWRDFEDVSLKICWGCMHEPFVVLFPLIPLPNPWEKGLDFWGFRCARVWCVLGGNPSIPLDSTSFWWTITWLWSAHEVFLLSPKSCSNLWSESGDRELDLEELTRGCCKSRAAQAWPVWPVCVPFVGFASGELLDSHCAVAG
jgi:hypothetical protein